MWRFLQLLSVCAAFVARAQVVINEIHYDPADRTRQEEFIELYNVGSTPVELGGWRLEDGVEFAFPAGIQISPGGFRVVAQNTACPSHPSINQTYNEAPRKHAGKPPELIAVPTPLEGGCPKAIVLSLWNVYLGTDAPAIHPTKSAKGHGA